MMPKALHQHQGAHKAAAHRLAKSHEEQARGTSTERGYDATWRRARKQQLARFPLCAFCLKDGLLTPATVVDHIVAIRDDPDRRLDDRNFRSLCKSHHDERTAREQSFGRRARRQKSSNSELLRPRA
jgi:5-methylcytosine-specific restriction protein A